MLLVVLLCSVVGVWDGVICVLYVMHVIAGIILWVKCVFRHVDLVCWSCCAPSSNSECGVLCSLFIFISDASGDHMMETYSSVSLVIAWYVGSIISFVS